MKLTGQLLHLLRTMETLTHGPYSDDGLGTYFVRHYVLHAAVNSHSHSVLHEFVSSQQDPFQFTT